MKFRKKGTPTLDTPPEDMQAEFLGAQYNYYGEDTYKIIRGTIIKLIFSNFGWEGLKRIESNFLERLLIMNGRALGVKSTLDVVNGTPGGFYVGYFNTENTKYDFYGQPLETVCAGLNGMNLRAVYPNFSICYDTTAHINTGVIVPPIFTLVDKLAGFVYDSYSAWRVAMHTSKAATIFNANDAKEANMIKRVLQKVSENDPYIVLQNGHAANLNPIDISFRNNTDHVKTFYDNYINSWGTVLDMLGFQNAAPNKHERLIVGEMQLNTSMATYVAADRLKAREDFAEEVRERMGIIIKPYNYLQRMLDESVDREGESENVQSYASESSQLART